MDSDDDNKSRSRQHKRASASGSKKSTCSDKDYRPSKITDNEDEIPFERYKNDFYIIFPDIKTLVNNLDDFWLFVKKYEAVNKKRKQLKQEKS